MIKTELTKIEYEILEKESESDLEMFLRKDLSLTDFYEEYVVVLRYIELEYLSPVIRAKSEGGFMKSIFRLTETSREKAGDLAKKMNISEYDFWNLGRQVNAVRAKDLHNILSIIGISVEIDRKTCPVICREST